jgi:hypothetical protein
MHTANAIVMDDSNLMNDVVHSDWIFFFILFIAGTKKAQIRED